MTLFVRILSALLALSAFGLWYAPYYLDGVKREYRSELKQCFKSESIDDGRIRSCLDVAERGRLKASDAVIEVLEMYEALARFDAGQALATKMVTQGYDELRFYLWQAYFQDKQMQRETLFVPLLKDALGQDHFERDLSYFISAIEDDVYIERVLEELREVYNEDVWFKFIEFFHDLPDGRSVEMIYDKVTTFVQEDPLSVGSFLTAITICTTEIEGCTSLELMEPHQMESLSCEEAFSLFLETEKGRFETRLIEKTGRRAKLMYDDPEVAWVVANGDYMIAVNNFITRPNLHDAKRLIALEKIMMCFEPTYKNGPYFNINNHYDKVMYYMSNLGSPLINEVAQFALFRAQQ